MKRARGSVVTNPNEEDFPPEKKRKTNKYVVRISTEPHFNFLKQKFFPLALTRSGHKKAIKEQSVTPSSTIVRIEDISLELDDYKMEELSQIPIPNKTVSLKSVIKFGLDAESVDVDVDVETAELDVAMPIPTIIEPEDQPRIFCIPEPRIVQIVQPIQSVRTTSLREKKKKANQFNQPSFISRPIADTTINCPMCQNNLIPILKSDISDEILSAERPVTLWGPNAFVFAHKNREEYFIMGCSRYNIFMSLGKFIDEMED